MGLERVSNLRDKNKRDGHPSAVNEKLTKTSGNMGNKAPEMECT